MFSCIIKVKSSFFGGSSLVDNIPPLSFRCGGGRGGAPRKGDCPAVLLVATRPGGGGGRLSSIPVLCGGTSG